MNDNIFFVDVLNILPEEIDCYIQSPDLEDLEMLKMMENSDYEYYKIIHLNSENKINLIEKLKNRNVIEFIQSIEIKEGYTLLFEGYDGIESGTFSRNINIPNWFKQKYKENWDYTISVNW